MLRPAIEQALGRFEKREGVRVVTVFEGCGTLVSSMKAADSNSPDAYFSCDVTYLDMVSGLFESDPLVVASNEMVILVPAGNPASIASVRDLANPGVKVGLCDAEKSALGGLTDNLLGGMGLLGTILPNVETRASKGDELVNQVQIGALDAAIVYRSNAMASTDIAKKCRVVELGPEAKDPTALQPFAVGKNTRFKQLIDRLRDTLTSAGTRRDFERLGFSWQADKK